MLLDNLDIKNLLKWLAALVAAVCHENHTGIKIPTNPAGRLGMSLNAKRLYLPFERAGRMTGTAASQSYCENSRYIFAIDDWLPVTGHSRTSATGPQESRRVTPQFAVTVREAARTKFDCVVSQTHKDSSTFEDAKKRESD
jgi:hypothetical protein